MVATVTTASYFLLTADYGFEPNALDPVSVSLIKDYILFCYCLQSEGLIGKKKWKLYEFSFWWKKVGSFLGMQFQNLLASKWSKCVWIVKV